MREIPLSRGLVAIVDDEDFERFGALRWHAHESAPGLFYAMRGVGVRPNHRKVYLHREIMDAERGVAVDHVNGNRLDCRRSNLRLCTLTQNQGNRVRNRRSSSRFKGVSLEHTGRWRAAITFQRQLRRLGSFVREEDAARAYDASARECFGQFARLNFPEVGERSALDNRENAA